MAEGGNNDRHFLSDTEILDALERLLRHPDFYDISLSFDAEEGKFYAGWEVGSDLRDVLRTVLMRNRPAGLELNDLLPSLRRQHTDSKNGNHSLELDHDGPAATSPDVLVHSTESRNS